MQGPLRKSSVTPSSGPSETGLVAVRNFLHNPGKTFHTPGSPAFLHDGALPSSCRGKYGPHTGFNSTRELLSPAENMARDMLLWLIGGYLHGRETRFSGPRPAKKDLGAWRGLVGPTHFSRSLKGKKQDDDPRP